MTEQYPQQARFAGTVPFYARYRLGYPQRLIERVIALTGLSPGDAVLDLGTGPGLLAVPFAAAGMKVTAADPEAAMLEAARIAASDAGVALDLWHGSSFELNATMGPYRLVTIGRAFHWMDRADTLRRLDRIVARDGAIALFHDRHPDTVENGWRDMLHEVGDAYGRAAAPHVVARRSKGYRGHESVLLDSPFGILEGVSMTLRKRISANEIVGRAFSTSTCSPARLGDRSAAFEADLRAALGALSPNGEFAEIVEIGALIARRPPMPHSTTV